MSPDGKKRVRTKNTPDTRRGPRGGTTTVSRRGWTKKNLWLPSEMAEELREKAFRHHLAEAEIVRRALLAFLPTLTLAILLLKAGMI